ncbi:MAG: hypothetical protein ACRDKV_01095, partial [Solirubrobacterales bacterium]
VQEIVDHYVDNKDMIFASGLVGVLAMALLVYFAGYLRKILSAAEGPGGFISSLVLVGASILAVGLAIDSTISFALAETAEDVDPSAVQAMQAIWDNDFLPIALGMTLFYFSAGLSIVFTGVLPKWLGWVAIVFGVLGPTPAFFVGFLGGAIWILIVSVLLARRAGPDTAGPVGTPSTGL